MARRQKLADEYEERGKAAATDEQKSVVFEDFSAASFAAWRASGSACSQIARRAQGDFVLGTSIERPILEFAAPGAAHSGLIAPRLRGALPLEDFHDHEALLFSITPSGGAQRMPRHGPTKRASST